MQLIVKLSQLEDSIRVIPSLEETISNMKVKLQALEKKVDSLTTENVELKIHSSAFKKNLTTSHG